METNEYGRFKGRFYGDRQIKEVTKLNSKTASGNKRVGVEFEAGDPLEIPLEQLELLHSEAVVDATTFRDRQMNPIILSTIGLLLEAEIPVEWMQFFAQKLGMSISGSLDKATEKLWGKKFYQLTLMDVDRVIRVDELLKPKDLKNK
jgi:hypothetical protein